MHVNITQSIKPPLPLLPSSPPARSQQIKRPCRRKEEEEKEKDK